MDSFIDYTNDKDDTNKMSTKMNVQEKNRRKKKRTMQMLNKIVQNSKETREEHYNHGFDECS